MPLNNRHNRGIFLVANQVVFCVAMYQGVSARDCLIYMLQKTARCTALPFFTAPPLFYRTFHPINAADDRKSSLWFVLSCNAVFCLQKLNVIPSNLSKSFAEWLYIQFLLFIN